MPRLVAQAPARRPQRGHHHHDQRGDPGNGEQHAWVVPHQIPGLREEPGSGRAGVTECDQTDVDDHGGERAEAQPAVPAGQPVLPVALLHPGDPGHQRHLDQHGVGGEQSREATCGGQLVAPARVEELMNTSAVHPQGEHDEDTGGHHVGQTVAPHRGRGGAVGPAGHRGHVSNDARVCCGEPVNTCRDRRNRGHPSPASPHLDGLASCRSTLPLHAGQQHPEGRAPTGLAVHADRSAVG